LLLPQSRKEEAAAMVAVPAAVEPVAERAVATAVDRAAAMVLVVRSAAA
jgi:hypothetical protein